MPVIPSTYAPPPILRGGHLQTVYPALFRRVRDVQYQRERIETPDDDFLDLDWARVGSSRLAILSHGLEGDAHRGYMRGMVRALNRAGWDALAWNFRGCSGTPNRQLRAYHSGATDDLDVVVQHSLSRQPPYQQVALLGFSLGGNLTLKYLGERGRRIEARLCGSVVFSVPCDLDAGCASLDRPPNWLYQKRFLLHLARKIRDKKERFPEAIDVTGYEQIKTLRAFDDRYTAPLHGFADAADYYARCSSKQFLPEVAMPTLLINAADDPLLPSSCYPVAEAQSNPCLFLETPAYGGHVGFIAFNSGGAYWSEQRAVQFLGTLADR